MPGLSGVDTAKQLMAMHPTLKVVMISSERNPATEQDALQCGARLFLHKPFDSTDIDRVLHSLYGLRCPTLNVKREQPDFDVAIEGSTIRLAHKDTGHVFEYLWFERPPHLRNAVIHPGGGGWTVAPAQVAHVAERAALFQLNENRLLAA
jgi:CheY-like chemotaxis protein